MNLTADNVEKLFAECSKPDGAQVEGVISKAVLDTTGRETEIAGMLAELPDEFQASGGGGWTFLNACDRRDGQQWTSLHATMEKLFMLGIAAGKARWLMPRDMWDVLPGGMPYVSVN
ncbi:hypothetical protein [Hyphomicrobium sp.]|uniref:hypothetical protein n=1 Tax=Hyphomicrobium sp. TaxID=82 RepID=UPI001DC708EC|nr:hypothetical protein [Hyphomicrobium sp.]MBY0559834.1 hypothetical protein [Hyphomicrobium sp.]